MALKPATSNICIFLLALLGVFVSYYLAFAYISGRPMICAINASGCAIVQASQYAEFLNFPVPWYGVGGYLFLALLVLFRIVWPRGAIFNVATILIFVSAALGFLFTTYLNYLEFFVIKAFCFWCTLSALVIAGIFIVSIFDFFYMARRK